MGRLDRYVLRVFLLHWLVIGGALLGLFSVFDLIAHGDELGETARASQPVFGPTLRYYLANLPFLLVLFAPYLTLLAGVGTVTQLMRGSEWTPMLSAGRSTRRAFLPILVGGLVLGLGAEAVREFVTPGLLVEREALSRRLFDQRDWVLADVWSRGRDDAILHAGEFRPGAGPGGGTAAAEILGFEIHDRRQAAAGSGLVDRLLVAERATWDGSGWQLDKGLRTRSDGGEEAVVRAAAPDLGPHDLLRAYFGLVQPHEMARADLAELLRRDPQHRQAATLIWAWRSAPLAHLILLLLGLPFVLGFGRRSTLEGVATGLLASAFYFVGDFLLRDLGGRGVVSPFLGGAGAPLVFGSLALWAQDRLPT
ncbi:MAG TPA: LptF/LptG family permease [Planctomycetota bacterium]